MKTNQNNKKKGFMPCYNNRLQYMFKWVIDLHVIHGHLMSYCNYLISSKPPLRVKSHRVINVCGFNIDFSWCTCTFTAIMSGITIDPCFTIALLCLYSCENVQNPPMTWVKLNFIKDTNICIMCTYAYVESV